MVNVPAAAAERICSLFIRLLLFILGIWKCLKEAYCLLLGKDQSFLMHLRQKCCCQRRSRNLFLYSSPFPLYRFWVSCRPEIVRQIDDDRLWRTSHHHPSKWTILRRVKFLMRQPSRHMQKIARPNSGRVFSEIAPSHTCLSFKDINDGVLFAMVMNASLR